MKFEGYCRPTCKKRALNHDVVERYYYLMRVVKKPTPVAVRISSTYRRLTVATFSSFIM